MGCEQEQAVHVQLMLQPAIVQPLRGAATSGQPVDILRAGTPKSQLSLRFISGVDSQTCPPMHLAEKHSAVQPGIIFPSYKAATPAWHDTNSDRGEQPMSRRQGCAHLNQALEHGAPPRAGRRPCRRGYLPVRCPGATAGERVADRRRRRGAAQQVGAMAATTERGCAGLFRENARENPG